MKQQDPQAGQFKKVRNADFTKAVDKLVESPGARQVSSRHRDVRCGKTFDSGSQSAAQGRVQPRAQPL